MFGMFSSRKELLFSLSTTETPSPCILLAWPFQKLHFFSILHVQKWVTRELQKTCGLKGTTVTLWQWKILVMTGLLIWYHLIRFLLSFKTCLLSPKGQENVLQHSTEKKKATGSIFSFSSCGHGKNYRYQFGILVCFRVFMLERFCLNYLMPGKLIVSESKQKGIILNLLWFDTVFD